MEQDEVPSEDKVEQPAAVEYLSEVVYPFELTDNLLNLYRDPVYNREELGDAYREVLLKMLRSAKYWRMDIPEWLIRRVKSLR